MRRLDIDLDTNEFDNFISKKGMSGLMKGITAQLGACLTEVSAENPEFSQEKIKGLSKSENARYQALMKSCLESKKKKPPTRPKGEGSIIAKPAYRPTGMSSPDPIIAKPAYRPTGEIGQLLGELPQEGEIGYTAIPTPDPVGEILDKKDKKAGNMKNYLMIGAAVVVAFIIYKNV